jgi:hypothetical protein
MLRALSLSVCARVSEREIEREKERGRENYTGETGAHTEIDCNTYRDDDDTERQLGSDG